MSYCPSCNELRETIIKPVESKKSIFAEILSNSETKYAQYCSKCDLQIFFPDAITRMQFLKCKEETTYKKYVYYPLLGLFIFYFDWNQQLRSLYQPINFGAISISPKTKRVAKVMKVQ